MDFETLRIFSTVATLQSFSRAAEQLGLPKARVSTAVQQLEARVGACLLHRTTRVVRLSEDGRQFLDRCRALLADAEQLALMFQPGSSALRGRLRVDLPTTLARDVLIPRLPEFLASHPGLELGLSTNDRLVDLLHEGFDCVLRVGRLADSGLVARPLGHLRMANAASPAYLRQLGTPSTLADLDHHRVVHYAGSLAPGDASWEYQDGSAWRVQAMRCSLVVNGTDAYQAACLAGLGLIQAPLHGLRAHFDAGRLIEVLPQHTAAPLPVALLVPHRRTSRRVQAFMVWLAEALKPHLQETART